MSSKKIAHKKTPTKRARKRPYSPDNPAPGSVARIARDLVKRRIAILDRDRPRAEQMAELERGLAEALDLGRRREYADRLRSEMALARRCLVNIVAVGLDSADGVDVTGQIVTLARSVRAVEAVAAHLHAKVTS